MADALPILGIVGDRTGFVTRLGLVGATTPARAEQVLGFRAGYLSEGYFIGVLREPLRAADVRFAGHTNSSGGRHGLPATTPAADTLRPRIHDSLTSDGYNVDILLKALVTDPRNLGGPERIIKLVAVSALTTGRPDLDYPSAKIWAPQFILTRAHKFFWAAHVGRDQIARTPRPHPGFDVDIGDNAPSDNRAQLLRYLRNA